MGKNTDLRIQRLSNMLLMLKDKENNTMFYTGNSFLSIPIYLKSFLKIYLFEDDPNKKLDALPFGVNLEEGKMLSQKEIKQKLKDFMLYYFQYDGVRGNRITSSTGKYVVFDRGRYKVLAYFFPKVESYRSIPAKFSAIAIFDAKDRKFVLPGVSYNYKEGRHIAFDRFNNIVYIANRNKGILQMFNIKENSVDTKIVKGDIYLSTYSNGVKSLYSTQVEAIVFNKEKFTVNLYTGYNGELKRILLAYDKDGKNSVVNVLKHPEYYLDRWNLDMFSEKEWDLLLMASGDDYSTVHYPEHKFHFATARPELQEQFTRENSFDIKAGSYNERYAHVLLASQGTFQLFRDNEGTSLRYIAFKDGKPAYTVTGMSTKFTKYDNPSFVSSVAYIGKKHFYIMEYLEYSNAVSNAFLGIYDKDTGKRLYINKSSPWRLMISTLQNPGRFVGLIHRQVNDKGVGKFLLLDTETINPVISSTTASGPYLLKTILGNPQAILSIITFGNPSCIDGNKNISAWLKNLANS
jgi:hypothetical protein